MSASNRKSVQWEGEADVRAMARLLFDRPGQVVEMRALGVDGRQKSVASGYFDNADALIAAARSVEKRVAGVYVTINEINPALLARASNRLIFGPEATTADADVVRRRFLMVDIDPCRPSKISSTDAEKLLAVELRDRVEAFLSAHGFTDPVVADSGNGARLLYRIDLPAADHQTIDRVLGALAARFNDERVVIDETVSNPARIDKLYGTLVRKGDSTTDRPHRRSRILRIPDALQVVSSECLDRVAAMAPTLEPGARSSRSDAKGFSLEQFIERNGLVVHKSSPWNGGWIWVLATCPFNAEHQDATAFIVRIANGAIAAGCHKGGCHGKSWHDLRALLEPNSCDPRSSSKSARARGVSESTGLPPGPVLSFEPFPTRVLPLPIRSLVEEGARSLGCDESFFALPLLATLAGVIGNARRIRLKRDWAEPAVIWTLIVGWSGTVKSPAIDLVVRPVRARQAKALRAHRAAAEQYSREMALYSKALKQWQNDELGSAPPKTPVAPIALRILVSDTTVESVAGLLAANPRGLLLVRDEFAGWILSFNAYRQGRGGDTARWLEIHRAGAITVDRRTSIPPLLEIPRAAVSITGGIQPPVLAKVLCEEHFADGLAARILLAMPPRKAKRWTDAEVSIETERAVDAVFDALWTLDLDRGPDGELAPVDLPMSPAGRAAWVKFYDEFANEQASLMGDLAAAWSKLEGYAARIGLIIHLARWAARDPELESADFIDERSVSAGIVIARWFGREAKRVYSEIGASEDVRETRMLIEMIATRGGSIAVRELRQSARRYQRTVDAAEQALQALVDGGLGKWEWTQPTRHGGRPSRRFILSTQAATFRADDETQAGAVVAGVSVSETGPSSSESAVTCLAPQRSESPASFGGGASSHDNGRCDLPAETSGTAASSRGVNVTETPHTHSLGRVSETVESEAPASTRDHSTDTDSDTPRTRPSPPSSCPRECSSPSWWRTASGSTWICGNCHSAPPDIDVVHWTTEGCAS